MHVSKTNQEFVSFTNEKSIKYLLQSKWFLWSGRTGLVQMLEPLS